MNKEKTNRIVIFKLFDEVSFESFDLTQNGYVLEYNSDKEKLFIQTGKESKPKWTSFLKPLIGSIVDNIINISSSFVLIISHNNSLFAITGGYGYTALKDKYEDDFGLNVALRMIDTKEISTINQRSMKGATRQLYRAVIGYDPLFDRENYNRILKHIEGKGKFEGRFFRVSGRSSLVLRTTNNIKNISKVIDEVEEILSKEIKIHFPRSYKPIKDSTLIEILSQRLFNEFKEFWENDSHRDNFYLEFDDPLIQFRCDHFYVKYGRKKIELNEFDLDILKKEFIEKGVSILNNLECLDRFKISGENESGFLEVKDGNFYNMLVFETFYNDAQYTKIGKNWYEILNEVLEHINKQLSLLKIENGLLPPWDINKFPREEEYNNNVASKRGWNCFDQDFIYIEGRSKIELCDIYDSNTKYFYHIKKTWGCKSAYLYYQASIAAESYRQSKSFREKCSEKWPELFSEEITDGTIVISIAAKKSKFENFPQNMTYFAKLNLYNAIALIKQNEFKVILAPVELTNNFT